MARKNQMTERPADLPPEKAHLLLKTQLEKLQSLKTRNYSDAKNDEDEFFQLTQRFLLRSFGSSNEHCANFQAANFLVGSFGGYEPDPVEEERSYRDRLQSYENVLKSHRGT
jgi:hypothetical protein